MIEDGLLNVQSGVGTVIGEIRPATAQQKQELLVQDIERLVVEARMLGLGLEDCSLRYKKIWQRLVQERP